VSALRPDQRRKRKLWEAVRTALMAVAITVGTLGDPKISFDSGFAFNFANPLLFSAVFVFFVALIDAIIRLAPFLTSPRYLSKEDKTPGKSRTHS
jgi:Na+/proline symporter